MSLASRAIRSACAAGFMRRHSAFSMPTTCICTLAMKLSCGEHMREYNRKSTFLLGREDGKLYAQSYHLHPWKFNEFSHIKIPFAQPESLCSASIPRSTPRQLMLCGHSRRPYSLCVTKPDAYVSCTQIVQLAKRSEWDRASEAMACTPVWSTAL